MGTSQRLGIDIVGKDKTAGAFGAVKRGMDSLTRSMNQLKALAAGAIGGNVLQSFVRGLVDVNKHTAPVREALDRLSLAWQGFALKVGDAGMNTALVNFANRLGALIMGSDGLSKSIGAFMSGAINMMANVLEGVGRAIAFVYDNISVLGRYLAVFGIAVFAQKVLGTAMAFVYFAKTVRATGIIMSAFSAISRANLLVFLALAAGVAYATDSLEDLKAGMDKIWAKVNEVFPQIKSVGKDVMEGLGFDMSSLSGNLVDMKNYIDNLGTVIVPTEQKLGSLGKATRSAGHAVKAMGTDVADALEPLKAYQEKLRILNAELALGKKTPAEYARAVQKLQDAFLAAGPAFATVKGPLKSVEDGMKKVKAAGIDIGNVLEDNIMRGIDSFVSGTESLGKAFKSMVNDILSDMIRLSLNSAFKLLFTGGKGLGLLGSLFGSASAPAPVTPGGLYGTTLSSLSGPQSVRPSETAGRNGVSKLVLEYRNAPPQVEQRRGADGNLELVVREMVSNDIASGRHDNAMMRFGLRPSPKVR